jgi:hypothetical protein
LAARQSAVALRRAEGGVSGERRLGSSFCFGRWFIPVPECTADVWFAVVICLTAKASKANLKFMSRFIFAALGVLWVRGAAAQQVPARDLLEFPLGLAAEAAGLSSRMPAALWNPAATALPRAMRAEFGFAGLATPQDQGVQLDMIGAAYRVGHLTTAMSYVQASVNDIIRTVSDPQSFPGEISYGTTMISGGAAGTWGDVSLGAAARYRRGTLDAGNRRALSIDGGLIVNHVAHTPARISLSTFLFSPWHSREATTYLIAADAPVLKRDSTFQLVAGYSWAQTEGRGRDQYVSANATYRRLEAGLGVLQTTDFGESARRVRLGLGLHYADYMLSLAREEGAGGFGASYQFVFTRSVK